MIVCRNFGLGGATIVAVVALGGNNTTYGVSGLRMENDRRNRKSLWEKPTKFPLPKDLAAKRAHSNQLFRSPMGYPQLPKPEEKNWQLTPNPLEFYTEPEMPWIKEKRAPTLDELFDVVEKQDKFFRTLMPVPNVTNREELQAYHAFLDQKSEAERMQYWKDVRRSCQVAKVNYNTKRIYHDIDGHRLLGFTDPLEYCREEKKRAQNLEMQKAGTLRLGTAWTWEKLDPSTGKWVPADVRCDANGDWDFHY